MRSVVPAALITVATLAGCGGHAVKIESKAQPVGNRWNAALATPAGLAGAIQVHGTGWLAHQSAHSRPAGAP